MVQYSLFVLKVPLNPKQTNKQVAVARVVISGISSDTLCVSSDSTVTGQYVGGGGSTHVYCCVNAADIWRRARLRHCQMESAAGILGHRTRTFQQPGALRRFHSGQPVLFLQGFFLR